MLLTIGLLALLVVTAFLFSVEICLRRSATRVRAKTSPSPTQSSAIEHEDVDYEYERDRHDLDRYAQSAGLSGREWREQRLTFASPTINFDDGWRRTPSPPQQSTSNVYVFGSSTVLSLEVRDDQTLPAALQRRLSLTSSDLRVLNRGMSGANVKMCLRELSDERLAPSDIVVVMFGVIDAKALGYPQRGKGLLGAIPGYVAFLGLLRVRLRLQLAQLIWRATVQRDLSKSTSISHQNATEVLATLTSMRQIALSHGATLIAVLEPHLWEKRLSTAEARLARRYLTSTPQMLETQYRSFRNVLANQHYFFDLSQVFVDDDETLFQDWSHTNARGNVKLADALCRLVIAS
ncbi:MAG: SGNH/GDSL hydrolase family protein [Acidimicrobiia bacterium]